MRESKYQTDCYNIIHESSSKYQTDCYNIIHVVESMYWTDFLQHNSWEKVSFKQTATT